MWLLNLYPMGIKFTFSLHTMTKIDALRRPFLEWQIRFLLTANSQHLCLQRHLRILSHEEFSQLFFTQLLM
ncbi:hypothetical protein ACE6H2_002163 [Prunus campanulata]